MVLPLTSLNHRTSYTYSAGTFTVAFTVSGQSDIWYPWTTNSLGSGSSVSFNGWLTFSSSLQGEFVSIKAKADSCSGDEFMPTHCRIDETNEGNNESSSISLTLPYDIVGIWYIIADWECDGATAVGGWEINSDGTFTDVNCSLCGNLGTWNLNGNHMDLTYNQGIQYTGTITGNYMEGTMLGAGGDSSGCWTADKL